MFDISEELKKLPQKPGIYIMKDENDVIIYVGKAINLKSRVRSYFQASSAKNNPKVKNLAATICEFEYIVTDNELEALILECNLIKKHRPKYNVMLKDDKAYPYLKVTVNEMFPRIMMTHNHEKDKAKYYGPYISVYAVKEIVALAQTIWPLRRCTLRFPRNDKSKRPCLNHHIGQCLAPCAGKVSEAEYKTIVDEVIQFLNGKHDDVLAKLQQQMAEFSEQMEFEKAAELRDTINAVKTLYEKQKIDSGSNEDQDVIAFARAHEEALVQVFFIRGGKMLGREHFMLNGVDGIAREEVMTNFVKQFYGETTFIPKELILEVDILEKEIITKWLSGLKGQNVTVTVPQKGEKLKLTQLAAKNALLTFEQFGEQMKREQQKTIGALQEIQDALGFDSKLERIEAYDISNIQGFESVGSMVVFENGKPKRSDYRKFKIKEVFGANDYASMEEVVTRRFIRYKEADAKFMKLPDVLFIDGGLGQIHSAEKVLRELGIDIPVCGMVKDDRHRTRGLMYQEKEVHMPLTSEGFKLVTRIQDEVHRFAIEYHRKLREKVQIKSVLDDIPGIGETRRKALLKHFGSIDDIRTAEIEQLTAVESINKKAAEAIYTFFRS